MLRFQWEMGLKVHLVLASKALLITALQLRGLNQYHCPNLSCHFAKNMHSGPLVPMVRPPVTSEVRILGRSGEHPV